MAKSPLFRAITEAADIVDKAQRRAQEIWDLQSKGHGRVFSSRCGHLVQQCRCSNHTFTNLGLQYSDLDRSIDDWCTACKIERSKGQ